MQPRVSGRRLAALLADRASDGPSYRWLADGIRTLIADGRLLHGTRLPSERELPVHLGVSRTTVTRAYAVLRERGYADARQGAGTVVTVPGGQAAGGGEPLVPFADPPAGSDLIDLTCAAPAAVPGLAGAYARAVERLPSYIASAGYFPLGLRELRERIAARYAERGVPTDADQIIVTGGALPAAAAVFRAGVRRADAVVVETPTYPNSLRALEHAGARVVGAPLVTQDPTEVAAVVRRSNARMMLAMPDFHNPTGGVWTDAQRGAMAAAWRASGVTGVVDETMSEVWLDAPVDSPPMAAYAPDCITLGSASKTVWGGLRIGWMRAPHALVGAIGQARLSMDLGVPVLEQLVLAELLGAEAGLTQERRAATRESRAVMLTLAQRCPGWRTEQPSGGLALWWHLPGSHSSQLVAAAERHGALLAPGSLFAVDGRGLERWIRTPYSLDVVTLRRAVERIARAWAEVTESPGRSVKTS